MSTMRRKLGFARPWGLLCLLALGMALSSGSRPAWADAVQLSSVDLVESGSAALVELRLSGPAEFQAERRTDPLRYVVYLPEASPVESVLGSPARSASGSSALARVLVLDGRAEKAGKGTYVVLYLDQRRPVKAALRADGVLAIAVNGPLDLQGPKPAAAPVAAAAPQEAPAAGGAAGADGSMVSAVLVSEAPDGANEIFVRAGVAPRYEARATSDTTYEVVLYATDAPRELSADWAGEKSGLVRDVRIERVLADGIGVRITVELTEKGECSVTPSEDGRELVIHAGHAAAEPTAPAESPAEPVVTPGPEGTAETQVASPEISGPGSGASGPEAGWFPLGGEATVAQGGSQVIPGPRRPTSSGGLGRGPSEGIGDATAGAGARFEPGPAPGLARVPAFLSEGRISLDFPGTTVEEALMAIANYGDVDIVVDKAQDLGSVSVTMTDVTPEEAIATICGIKDLVWVKRGETYIVATRESIQNYLAVSDRVVENYYPLHQDAAALDQYLELVKRLHPRVLVQKYSDPGVLVLAGDAVDVNEAMMSLRRADKAREEGIYSPSERVELCSLQSGNASELAGFLKQVFGDRLQVIHRSGTQQIALKGPDPLVSEAKEFLAELDRQGGKIVTLTYKPTRHSPEVVQAAVKEQFPEIATHVKTVDGTLIITGAEKDAQAAMEHAKAVDLSLATRAESVEEYRVESRYLRGLERLAQQACPEVTVTGLPQTKTLVIMGPAEPVARCLEKVRAWDTAPTTEIVTENVRVIHQEPGYLAETLMGLKLDEAFQAQPSGEMLALTGPSVAVSEAVAILRELDQPPAPGSYALEIASERYVLRWASVTEAMQMLSSVFGEKQDMKVAAQDTPSVQVRLRRLAEAQGIPVGPPSPTGSPAAPEDYYLFGQGGPFGPGPDSGAPPAGDMPAPGSGSPDAGLLDGTVTGQPPLGDDDTTTPPEGGLGDGSTAGANGPAAAGQPANAGASSSGEQIEIWLSVGVDMRNHALLLAGPRWAVKRAVAMLEQFDIAPHQVVLECVIADVNRNYLKDKGIDWDWGSTVIGEADGDGMNLRSFSRSGFSFTGTFALTAQNDKTKLLANPKIRCVDGGTGHIQIGDTLRYRVLQPNPGGTATYSTETADVGIIVDFTPRVTGDGHVVLDLTAESSSISGYIDGLPQVRTRRAETEVVAGDGETIVIGGLIREDEIETLKTVPFLSDIPVLGQLFRHRKVTKAPQELVFFMTPKVIYSHDGTLRSENASGVAEGAGPRLPSQGAVSPAELEQLSSNWTAMGEYEVPAAEAASQEEQPATKPSNDRPQTGALARIGNG